MKISVIVPVYNGEKYLKKTIELILNQSYKDVELILVNDGSTDSSRNICEKYVKTDSRVVLINRKNAGISVARNTGLEAATGEWVSFIDQDDEISNDIYNRLTEHLNPMDDMVVAGKKMLLIDEKDNVLQENIYNYKDETVVDKSKILKNLCNINNDTRLLQLWNCLYKREIIDLFRIRFNTNFKYGHEDTLFNFEYVTKCKEIRYVNGIVYTYSRRMARSTSLKENKLFLNDYKIYCDNAGRCLQNLNEKEKSMFFTYLFRLGINLYKQYGCHSDNKALVDIYIKAQETAGSGKICRMYVATTKLYIFYLICISLIKINRTDLCNWIIKVSPKKH